MLRDLTKVSVVILMLASISAWADQTPPVMPKITETLLPPPVELTLPEGVSLPVDMPNRPLTANEAASVALHHQPNIVVAGAGLTSAQGRSEQAKSGLLPSLSLSTGYVHVDSSSINGSTSSGSAGVSATGFQSTAAVRQLLFDFNHTRSLAEAAEVAERSASANLSRAQSDLVLQVKQAFYTYTQNLRLITANETNLRNQQNHLALAQARLKAGVGLPSDVVRAETAVADAILSLNLARNGASISRVNLALLMGIDPRTPIQAASTGELVIAADDVNALVDTGLKQRPEILQAQANIQSSRYSLNAVRTSNVPSLSASVGYTGRGDNLSPDANSLTAGVTLSFTPFDSGLTAGRVKESQGNLKAAQAQMDSTRLTVISDVSQAFLNLKTAEQRVVTAQAEVANGEESEHLTQGRYSAGLGTFLDVLDAQSSLLTAQTNLVNAQSAVDQARASLSHAIGAPVNANL